MVLLLSYYIIEELTIETPVHQSGILSSEVFVS